MVTFSLDNKSHVIPDHLKLLQINGIIKSLVESKDNDISCKSKNLLPLV